MSFFKKFTSIYFVLFLYAIITIFSSIFTIISGSYTYPLFLVPPLLPVGSFVYYSLSQLIHPLLTGGKTPTFSPFHFFIYTEKSRLFTDSLIYWLIAVFINAISVYLIIKLFRKIIFSQRKYKIIILGIATTLLIFFILVSFILGFCLNGCFVG
ncbi:MAG: hypothetical protein COV02_00720 [Candidatus Terrybacteria bacterium CG10_big_fil_rev_8_21_14_0_10_41_10]|uniref:Uncharacterized protein n=1 Tax=Candidatus Terrybacteria bacterium CG10_big_fil_rev_8_21_14_0_10_41_10 TaxID=1975026 RepID=A0A2M8LAW6_9BACT|nr:MAG: hypothetical protein COV02_00720 [Candidatus Terrybacteria bacterium CG10_big_fil_rev_8_21_14_0_10_41_10]